MGKENERNIGVGKAVVIKPVRIISGLEDLLEDSDDKKKKRRPRRLPGRGRIYFAARPRVIQPIKRAA